MSDNNTNLSGYNPSTIMSTDPLGNPQGVSPVPVVGAYSQQQYFVGTTLTDAATITWDLNSNQAAKVTLGGNRNIATPTNMKAGGMYMLLVTQDSTGSRTVNWGRAFRWENNTPPTLTTTPGATDRFTFVSDGSYMYAASSIGYKTAVTTSVQQVSITLGSGVASNTATITSVDTTRAIIIWNGQTFSNSGIGLRSVFCRIALTNATTVTAVRDTANTDTCVVQATVIEFDPTIVSSVQTGTVTIPGDSTSTSATATITSVDTTRSTVVFNGFTTNSNGTNHAPNFLRVSLTNSTTVTANVNAVSTVTRTIAYTVIKFAPLIVNSVQQRAVTSTSAAATISDTISSVNTSNAMIFYNGVTTDILATNGWTGDDYEIRLTSSTNVDLVRSNATDTNSRTISYTVVEFVSNIIGSIQRGEITMTAVNTTTGSISSIDTSKSIINWTGQQGSATAVNSALGMLKINTSTQIQADRSSATNNLSEYYEVIQFA